MQDRQRCNIIIGRFQPLTLGHIKGMEYVYDKYKIPTMMCIIDTPKEKLDNKHPFESEFILSINQDLLKMDYCCGFITVKSADIGSLADGCRKTGFEPIMWTCGSDRFKAYSKQAQQKYIDMFELDPDFKIVEIPRADDDISATKVREALKENDLKTFKSMMPKWSYRFFNSLREVLRSSITENISLRDFIVESLKK